MIQPYLPGKCNWIDWLFPFEKHALSATCKTIYCNVHIQSFLLNIMQINVAEKEKNLASSESYILSWVCMSSSFFSYSQK